ncbi:MAG: response regulator transcription factor [Oceanospirillaceae bacterium]|nr:response regulator transcription factor [Oceanospirillaceae bacterium]
MNTVQKIIIADDHPLFRQALLQTLKSKLTNVQWIEAQTVEQLSAALAENPDAELLLLDLNIPGAHGFNTLIKIRSQYKQLPVVVVSAYEDDDTVIKSMEFGAAGFVPKSTPVEQIFIAIEQVLKGDTWLPEHINLNRVADNSDIGDRVRSLTPQQHKILLMFADGLLNKQIAHELSLSEATVKAHATAIFRKLKVLNRTQAVIAIAQLEVGSTSFSSSKE